MNLINPDIEDASHVFIWAAMNVLPMVLGVILLTGILSAGISSATTFLSLIGSTFANDFLVDKGENRIRVGQVAMIVISALVLLIAVVNPPQVFWIMMFGGSIIASAWMPVAFASILSKRLTKVGAYAGMLAGFVSYFMIRIIAGVQAATLPMYLDPCIIGMICNVLGMVIGSKLTQVTEEEKKALADLQVLPESEQNVTEMKKTLKFSKVALGTGAVFTVVLLVFWVIPYLNAAAA